MARLRVLVVEDSRTVREHLIEVLSSDPDIEIVGQAADGRRAIELCRDLRPDVMTLDMMLPVMTGLAVTEYVMAHFPTPILIVSSSINRGEVFHTYDALAAGAVDVLDKAAHDAPGGAWERRFLAAVKIVSRIKVITHPRLRIGRLAGAMDRAQPAPAAPAGAAGDYGLVAIGASTGGPGAVVEVLRAMPANYPIPILLVLHIGEPFGALFADWLDAQTHHRVAFATDGADIRRERRVLMAPPGRHMVLDDWRVRLTCGPERFSCRPSVDVLFESIAGSQGAASAACLLTGMGRDGASGLRDIRAAGGFTIAQDEATSVVYGMPREAALLGAAAHILPLHQIGPALAALAVPAERSSR